MYIDTHCHISKKDYDNIDQIIKDAEKNNVKKLIISGCDKDSIKESLEIAKKYENVYLSLGYHPSEVDSISQSDIDELKKIVTNNEKVVAIGEIGLDYYWVKDNKDKQKELFKIMLDLANELNLPVIIHSRDAYQDTYDILKEKKSHGIIHCFSGSLENAKNYINLGFFLGIGGVITFKNTNLKGVIKELSLKNLVLETDSPYLAPTPYRGTQNAPKYIPIIAEEIANIKDILKETVEEETTKNVKELFGIE
ncbi:MAG: TatD family hydrolase [Bacilli bacterium]|nr:TatD family hydrolase [Bacilli bacterium]